MSASQRLPLDRKRAFGRMVFETLADARDGLYVLLFAAHDFIVDTREIRISKPKDWTPSSDLVTRQERLRTDFLKWHTAFEERFRCPSRPPLQHEVEPYSLLHVVYSYYFILVCTGLSMYETDFDKFFPIFQTMVDHASRIVTPRVDELRPVFMFETRVIPSLFAVGVKCRHPVIRRQAIALLRNGTRVENTWRADAMADIAEWSVGIEESGSIHGVFCPEPPDIELPPENHRVHWSQVIELPDSDGRASKFHQVQKWEQDEHHVWSLVDHLRRENRMISYQGIVAICIASAAALVTMGFVVHRLLIKRPDVADPFTPSDDQRRYMREVRERNIVEALGNQRLR
ncbi:hypothetical protein AYO21_09082 [Fonsecaea monophora]|uniref:Uncharacterized protein n=1 Tax=Fonsecaea monophora TaxID=254056 RepID=A0A177EXL8_9EURO|nr:hypothetical protein AYO21_09082 [Fonsecaea monophora]OAG36698.1 hypothetical protein AYO21_09082 [Fonsecaea monophora]